MKKNILRGTILLTGLCLVFGISSFVDADEISVLAIVEKGEVYVGESFVLWIQVEGTESPDEVDVSAIKDFEVKALGGRTNSSQSIVIINGRMQKTVKKGYVFSYRLSPKREGELIIPSIKVTAAGLALVTNPIRISVKEPAEMEDFKLRLTLSKETCYVGEPVILTVVWYLGKDVRRFELNLPVLENQNFDLDNPEFEIDRSKRYRTLSIGSEEVIAWQGAGTLEEKTYTTITFKKVLIPKKAGKFSVGEATVAFEALTGGRKRRSLLDEAFSDEFLLLRRETYGKFVIPSNDPVLAVLDVPLEGRPANYAGHIGEYRIEARAAPTEVNVGDPITLTVTLSGQDFLRNVEMPALKDQSAIARDFKIPEEMAPGKIAGKTKVFTQTIRATHADVKEIPPLELAYFDTKSGTYKVARTKPIPLIVNETRVLTARDAEGRKLLPVKTELEAWSEGIAHNYEDPGVLVNQEYSLERTLASPFWIALAGGPLLAYLVLFVSATIVRRNKLDPRAREAKKAYARLVRRLKDIRKGSSEMSDVCGPVLEALRVYLRKKLRLGTGAITFRDLESELKNRGVAPEILQKLDQLFEACEAGHYAGGADDVGRPLSIPQNALELARKLERSLK